MASKQPTYESYLAGDGPVGQGGVGDYVMVCADRREQQNVDTGGDDMWSRCQFRRN